MNRYVWLLVAILSGLSVAKAQDTKTREIVDRAKAQGSLMQSALGQYAYSWTFEWTATNKSGKSRHESRTYEVYVPNLTKKYARNVKFPMVLKARDGVPIPDQELEKARMKAGRELEKADVSADKSPDSPTQNGYMRVNAEFNGIKALVSINDILDHSEFAYESKGTVNGRSATALNFNMKKLEGMPKELVYMSHLTGRLWVDVEDGIVVAMAAWDPGENVGKDMAECLQKAVVTYEVLRSKNGHWLPSRAVVDGTKSSHIFNGLKATITYTFTDYVLFRVDSDGQLRSDPGPRPPLD